MQAPDREGSAPRTILFAEDNDDLRDNTEFVLSMKGYRVVACRDGERAWEAYLQDSSVDLLLTDLEMPERSGLELARAVTAACPWLPVLIVSGAMMTDAMTDEIASRDWNFLSKPCRPAILLARVDALLEG